MKRRKFIKSLGCAGLLLIQVMLGNVEIARSDNAVDRLSLPHSIEFNGESYRLSWSSHPKPYYYKQEYLPPGQTSERFQRMVLIEAIVWGVDVNGAVASKVNMLNNRKATDPTVNFAIFKNPKNDEIILDFILSAKDPKGEDVVEWNAYRYATLRGKNGASGVLLFGISRRAYGDDTANFLRRRRHAAGGPDMGTMVMIWSGFSSRRGIQPTGPFAALASRCVRRSDRVARIACFSFAIYVPGGRIEGRRRPHAPHPDANSVSRSSRGDLPVQRLQA